MPAKLLVMILLAGSFQRRHAVNLLLSRQIKTGGVATYTSVLVVPLDFWRFSLFPVNAAARCPMAATLTLDGAVHIIGGARNASGSQRPLLYGCNL
ncbi:hypothetical protein MJ561_01300 [Klebsiella pneumoniae]|nr:hypothetical protein MJ561_01300 [Klebsiella pneumoniae]